jgi:branched-chain amino acid aminotransferase
VIEMEKELLVYIDGAYYPKSKAKISVYDHGLLYGDGVFEGIRAYRGVVFRLKEHVDRLYRSAHIIMLRIPIKKQEMIEAILETLRKNHFKDAYIRVVVTRGVGDLGLDPNKCSTSSVIIMADSIQLHAKEAKEKGITTMIVWLRRDPIDSTSHEIKSLNYLNSILAKIEANTANYDEALFLDKNGYVCEGVGENLFIVKTGKIITPPTSTGSLAGITRAAVIDLAKKNNYELFEANITSSDLFTADEAFFTGTAAEIVPIVEVNKRSIGNGKPGPITKQIMSGFTNLLGNPNEGIMI